MKVGVPNLNAQIQERLLLAGAGPGLAQRWPGPGLGLRLGQGLARLGTGLGPAWGWAEPELARADLISKPCRNPWFLKPAG